MDITVCLLEANEATFAIFWKGGAAGRRVCTNGDLNNQQLLANPLPRRNGTPQSYNPLSSDRHLVVSYSADSRYIPGHITCPPGSKRLRTESYRSVIDKKSRDHSRKEVRSDAKLEERITDINL
jgi:hypothetical protein